jgi:ankyrin repeat protein
VQDGQTALHYACKNQNLIIVDLVIAHGINIWIKDQVNKTIILAEMFVSTVL